MSKYHNNYNRMYNQTRDFVDEETVVTPVVEEEPAVVPEVVDEPVTETAEVTPMLEGVISDCTKLNIRMAPSTDAEIVTVLYAGTKLMVDSEQSEGEWYSVCTLHGIEGFCMKKFVTIKE